MKLKTKNRKWVLVVEDDAEVREALVSLIKASLGASVQIVEAKDGLEATSRISCQVFHCIITDMKMPRKEGGAFILSARQNAFNELTPIVIVSGECSPDIEKEFEFVNFVAKPFDSVKLMDLIHNLLNVGSSKNRISADVFNNLIESTCKFLKQTAGGEDSEIKTGMAKAKKTGEDLEVDYSATITVKIGKVTNTFSILSNKSGMEKLREVKKMDADMPLESICRSMGYVILKNVLTRCGVIDPKEFSSKEVTEDKSVLQSKKGIVIPVSVNDLEVFVFASLK